MAALRRGRLKECNQTRPLSVFFFWGRGGVVEVELAIYRYLTWKRTLQLQNILEFEFSRKREESVANSWESETGPKIVRLGKSVTNHRAFLTSCTNIGIESGIKILADVILVLVVDFSLKHLPSAQQTTGHPSKCHPLPHPHPLQTTSHLWSRITTTRFIYMTVGNIIIQHCKSHLNLILIYLINWNDFEIRKGKRCNHHLVLTILKSSYFEAQFVFQFKAWWDEWN